MPHLEVLTGDCRLVMADMEEASIDAICTDPPYLIDFMGKGWDRVASPAEMQAWHLQWALEAYRVLKPGAFLLAFGGTRTYHRLVCALEDAGFEIRDSIGWLYGSGFPKSRNAAAAVDQHLGVEGTYGGVKPGHEDFTERTDAHAAGGRSDGWDRPWRDDDELVARSHQRYLPGSEAAAAWDGWGTALKPSIEPIVVARKPLVGTIGRNLVEHGTGAINIDGCRIAAASRPLRIGHGEDTEGKNTYGSGGPGGGSEAAGTTDEGRWPPNVVLTHTPWCRPEGAREVVANTHFPADRPASMFVGQPQDANDARMQYREEVEVWACGEGCPVAALDAQAGDLRSGAPGTMRLGENTGAALGTESRPPGTPMTGYGDAGAASRFYPTFEWDLELDVPFCYAAKASRSERDAGLDAFEMKPLLWSSGEANPGSFQSEGTVKAARNPHPTVKPVELMRWLLRLVTPPNGVALDPFTGSGTTGVAAAIEGIRFVGIEEKPDYAEIAEARIAHAHLVRDVVRAGRARLRGAVKAPAGQDTLW